MSSYSLGIRGFVVAGLLTVCFASTTSGADPKVVRASHEVTARDASRETQDSNDAPQEPGVTNDVALSYSPQWPEPPNTGAMLLRLCGGTVAVLGLCVTALWLGKPWLKRLQLAGTGSPSFFIEGSVAVGNRAMLYLVRVGETQLVAGVDAAGLKSLIALPISFKDVLEEQIPAVEPAVVTSPAPFDLRSLRRPETKE